MKRLKICSIIACLTIPLFSIASSDLNSKSKSLYVNVDTNAGQEILKSEMEYKDYLNKKIGVDAEYKKDQQSVDDIKNLKKAVAKLILEKNAPASVQIELEKINIRLDSLTQENKTLSSELNDLKLGVADLGKYKLFKLNKTPEPVFNERNGHEKDANIDLLSNQHYENREYSVAVSHIYFYAKPEVGEKSISKKLIGESFVSSKYDDNGWVYSEGNGWAKGYLLSPRLLQK